MPVIINGQTYYRTVDVCRALGISRNTLFRWFKKGIFEDAQNRDWRGWSVKNDAMHKVKEGITTIPEVLSTVHVSLAS